MLKKKLSGYKFGILAERVSMLFLIVKGYQILEWRFKSHFGEIDILAKKSNIIIAIEVKARKKKVPIEAVLHPKQVDRIKNSLNFFIAKNNKYQRYDLRFDFIEVNRFLLPKHHLNFIG